MPTREPPQNPSIAQPHDPNQLVDVEAIDEPSTSAAPPPVMVFAAEAIEEDVEVVDERSLLVQWWRRLTSALEWLFGLGSIIAGLALLASIPIVQFLSLGYLLEVSGRIARNGRVADGFIGIRKAARMGSITLGTWLMLWPVRLVAGIWRDAVLIDPQSGITFAWRVFLVVFTTVMIGHILLAWYCGGKLRHFFWPLLAPVFFAMWGMRRLVASETLRPVVQPVVGTISERLLTDLTTVPALTDWFPPAILWSAIRHGGIYVSARDAVWDFVTSLQLPYYFWLGLRGFAGAIAWLFVPVMLVIATTHLELDNDQASQGLGGLAGFIGSVLLAIVVLYLPFLQAHFAAEKRFVAMFELGIVRRLFRRAPIAFWFALLVTLGFSLPLYLLKIEYIPRETVWVSSVVFVIFILPARFITGWAVARARKRKQPRFFFFRWLARFGTLPVVAIYAFIIYFTQYLSWYGSFSLFEQHAFLTPVPFLAHLRQFFG